MNVFLLYPDREWSYPEKYFDSNSIVQDLGLKTLFNMASKEVFAENGEVKKILDSDPYINSTMSKVMLCPLKTAQEIYYRQDIIKDCLENEDFIIELYAMTKRMLDEWDRLGRKVMNKQGGQDNMTKLITRIHELNLFINTLTAMKELFRKYSTNLNSEGLKNLRKRLETQFSDELQADLERIAECISFYISGGQEKNGVAMVNKTRIVIECGIGNGMKMANLKLKDVVCEMKRYRDPKSAIGKVQEYINSFIPDSVSVQSSMTTQQQATTLEYNVVKYIVSFTGPFMDEFEAFFDNMYLQTAFYRGAVNLRHHMKRFHLEYCYPRVCEKDKLQFHDLKEFVMCIEQRVDAVGNTCNIDGKMLIIITGANQGGKSTFLRSLGIAQVMMQCGLPVAAVGFQSAIFPSLFTHFTRREDSEMNSGRLDEELGRMSQIVDNLGPDSLILLNESFATTTEKEGSVIAYDIIKALNEQGVKIVTVTHLLSFAQKVYAETQAKLDAGETVDTTFFCAERKDDGSRTYKMIQSVPELTSFGLDLYEKMIGSIIQKQ